jgi:hypothetical protein
MMNIVLAILVDSFTEAQAALKCEQARRQLAHFVAAPSSQPADSLQPVAGSNCPTTSKSPYKPQLQSIMFDIVSRSQRQPLLSSVCFC